MADVPTTEELLKRDFDLHVICNSHLDREWTEHYQFTRFLTVRFLDNLLQVMKDVPEYQFLLDSQTVPLEDYLEMRPENEGTLRELIAAKRLWVGPWYTAPDYSCISGEAIVRNMLIGHKIAQDFGHVMKVGYTPFGFGQPSQLPQIYAGFGIDMIWFYRGVSEREVPGICFRWEGADGTTAFCSRANRYNFYFGVIRPIAKNGGVMERDYDYSLEQLPIHLCDDQRTLEHAILGDSKMEGDVSRVRDLILELLKDNTRVFPGDVISFMNGMDTSMPTILDARVVEQAKKDLPKNWNIRFSNLPDYVEAFRNEVEGKGIEIPMVKGERRDAGAPCLNNTMLGDIITSRPEQKRRMARAETGLQRYSEPLATIGWLLGEEYPAVMLERGWKELCRCHPHDTIAGAGIDQIEKDILNRLDQVIGLSETMTQFSLGDILKKVDLGDLAEEEIPFVVFNPSTYARSETLKATVDLPNKYGFEGFELFDGQTGEPVEFCITSWNPNGQRVVRDVRDAPTSFFCANVEIDFVADNVPPMGWKTFIIRKAGRKGYCKSLLADLTTMENAFVRVEVSADGTFTLLDKATGETYSKLHEFRDRGEAGNAWWSEPPSVDTVVTSVGAPARISVVHDSPLRACLKVEKTMVVPSGLDGNDEFTFTRRGDATGEVKITSYLSLCRDSRSVDIHTVIDNQARSHVLQVLFPTGSDAKQSASDTAFDIVKRGIERDEDHSYSQAQCPTYPMLRFADVSDGKRGLAVSAVGVRGYEAFDDANRTLSLVLLRAFEIYLCTVSYRWERRPDQLLSQALGRHEMTYSVMPNSGGSHEDAVREGERLNVPMLIVQTGRHAGTLPKTHSMLCIEGGPVEFSAIKKKEYGDGLVVRLFNPSDETQNVSVTCGFEIASACAMTMEELLDETQAVAVDGREIHTVLGPKKVATLEINPR